MNRTWLHRSEIAEIYEAMAKKRAAQTLEEQVKQQKLMVTAGHIRDTDRLFARSR